MVRTYLIAKTKDGKGKTITADDTKAVATYYNARLSNVTISNTEILYADGANANCITLKDKGIIISYDEGRVSISDSKNDKQIDPNSAEGRKLLKDADKVHAEADKFTKEIANSKALQYHKSTKEIAKESQEKFANRVNAHTATKKAKQRVAQGVRGAQASAEDINDPNLDLALGKTPKYSSGKTASAPKQDRVTADNVDQKVDEILDKASKMTEDEIIDRFEKANGKGSWEAVKKAEEARIKAERMSKQRRGGR